MLWGIPAEVNRFFRPVVKNTSKPIRNAHPPTYTPHSRFSASLRQFQSQLVNQLDAGFIAAVLGLNAIIGGYQEWRAERSTPALPQLLQIRAAVKRDGEACEMNVFVAMEVHQPTWAMREWRGAAC